MRAGRPGWLHPHATRRGQTFIVKDGSSSSSCLQSHPPQGGGAVRSSPSLLAPVQNGFVQTCILPWGRSVRSRFLIFCRVEKLPLPEQLNAAVDHRDPHHTRTFVAADQPLPTRRSPPPKHTSSMTVGAVIWLIVVLSWRLRESFYDISNLSRVRNFYRKN